LIFKEINLSIAGRLNKEKCKSTGEILTEKNNNFADVSETPTLTGKTKRKRKRFP